LCILLLLLLRRPLCIVLNCLQLLIQCPLHLLKRCLQVLQELRHQHGLTICTNFAYHFDILIVHAQAAWLHHHLEACELRERCYCCNLVGFWLH
jgi:hypothetical protein